MTAVATELILDATKVRKEFGGLTACNDIDFTIPRGSIVSLIGPNGAGKTTFFNMITGLYEPTSGKIVFNGEDITGEKPHEVVRAGIGRTFQNIRLFGNMTAIENVLVGLHHTLKGTWWQAILQPPSVRREEGRALERGRELLNLMNLGSRESDYARNLPYGDQRRLEIARALATDCKLLLLDEPTAGMNPEETRQLTAYHARRGENRRKHERGQQPWRPDAEAERRNQRLRGECRKQQGLYPRWSCGHGADCQQTDRKQQDDADRARLVPDLHVSVVSVDVGLAGNRGAGLEHTRALARACPWRVPC